MNESSHIIRLRGMVDSIRYHNDENGYTVLDIVINDAAKASDEFSLLESDSFTAVGYITSVSQGEMLELSGRWIEHPEYGEQFKFERFSPVLPENSEEIEKYLASGLIDSVGPATAKNIVAAFGENTLKVIETQSHLLTSVKGIGEHRAAIISESFIEQSGARSTVIALQQFGVSTQQAVKLYQCYGPDALNIIQENPYRLITELEGIGFRRADDIALGAGVEPDSIIRKEAALLCVLQSAQNDSGHSCYPFASACEEAAALIGEENIDLMRDCLTQMTLENRVVTQFIDEAEMVFLPWVYEMETSCARNLLTLNDEIPAFVHIDLEHELETLEQNSLIHLDDEQRRAVLTAFERGTLIITGGPGTGKTTILNFILQLMDKFGMEVALCAPTGRAAKRLSEATGAEAATVHRLLGYNGETFEINENNPLECDALIVDEMSMVDIWLFYHLLKSLNAGTRLILVGDEDQLPSVGAGNVLGDIIKSQAIPVIRLRQVFRQGARSRIITNAHKINNGEMPLLDYTDDFAFQQIGAPQDILKRIIGICTAGKLGDPWDDIQIMSPTKKGVLGVVSLNNELQKALNPREPGKHEVSNGERIFRVGDKVMQIKNNYKLEWKKPGLRFDRSGMGVFNGDMGTIINIYPQDRSVELLFDDERTAFYDFKTLNQLELAYAISIHKSQGSEFPIVLMPLSDGPPMLYTRNLLYTAVTRARQRVVIIGRQSTISFMVQNEQERKRFTYLAETMSRLHEIYSSSV